MALTEVSAFKDSSIATGDIADDAITAAKIANAAVTTNEIQNLRIINNDISNSAAIAGSKISPSFTSDVTVDSGTNTLVTVKCGNAGNAIVRAGGGASNGQGTGAFEVTQNNGTHGGGISYNGDSNPSFVSGEQSDHITFYRLSAGTRTEVFHYPYNSNIVNFNSVPTVGGISLVRTSDTITDATNAVNVTGTIASSVTGTTQSAGDNSTKIATTAYVDNASGGGSASQLTDTNGTVKVEVDTSTIFLKDTVHIRDSLPTIHFKSSDGNTNYGWFRSFSASTEIFNRVSGGETKFKVQAGGSTINKILIRNTSGGTQTNPDVCIGRSMVASGKPTDLNAFFPHTGGVELYHISGSTGTKKFETTANGITVQGSVTTEDINMSNLNASANEVDNTKGSWTIQEGASDLFLINRVNGKKYKFDLTEIF